MSSSLELDPIENPKLTIRDRMDWAYLLQVAVHTLFNNLRNIDIEPMQLEITIGYLEGLIPDALVDGEYITEIKKLTKEEVVDLRPKFGGVPMREDKCIELGIKPYEKTSKINPTEKFHALMNLLQRIGVVAQKDRVEKFGQAWNPDEHTSEEANPN